MITNLNLIGNDLPKGGSLLPFDPVTILNTGDLFIDHMDYNAFTSSTVGDSDKRVVNALTTKGPSPIVSTSLSSGSDRFKPYWNGEATWFDGEDGYLLGTNADWKALHDGTTDYTLYVSVKVLAENIDSNTPYKIFCTVNNLASNTTVGFQFNFYNRASTTNTASVKLSIYNAGGGNPGVFEVISAANTVVIGSYNIFKIVFNKTSPSLQLYVKNPNNPSSFALLGQDLVGTGLSSANSVTALQIGGAAGCQMYIKHIFLIKRLLSAGDQTNIENYLTTQTAYQITETYVNTYLQLGQSNEPGEGLVSQISPELTGVLGGKVFFCPGETDASKTGFWATLQTGVSVRPSDPTKHGNICRWAYEMNQAGAPIHLIRRGQGSTYLIPNEPTPDASWSPLSQSGVNDLYTYYANTILVDAIAEMKHGLRKKPLFRGLQMLLTENDSTDARGLTTQAKYKLNLVALVTQLNAAIISQGVPRADIKMRYRFVLAKDIEAYLKGPDVKAAIIDVCANYRTENPSETDIVLGFDTPVNTNSFAAAGIHYTSPGLDSIGQGAKDYFIQFVNE